VIGLGGIVPEQNRRTIIHADQNIDRTIVVEVPDRQAACGEGLRKYGATLLAYIFECAAIVVKQKQRLALCNFV
jgi:hypothetical protein